MVRVCARASVQILYTCTCVNVHVCVLVLVSLCAHIYYIYMCVYICVCVFLAHTYIHKYILYVQSSKMLNSHALFAELF